MQGPKYTTDVALQSQVATLVLTCIQGPKYTTDVAPQSQVVKYKGQNTRLT
jgi:hypothetical protein